MIPLYLQRAKYLAEEYFLFNIFEGARILRTGKGNKSALVQMKPSGPAYYRSQFTITMFYRGMVWKLSDLESKANQFPPQTYKAMKKTSVRICHRLFNQL